MRLQLQVEWVPRGRDEDDPLVYIREVERDYYRVPTIGETVDLGEDWLGLPVTGVVWDHHDTFLEFEAKEVEGLEADFPAELEEHGFYFAGPRE